ncbi:MAG: polyprenyl synthetase family protein [Candidatus Eremiobacteraeota bacterium]|nr:polyprenyl synthetase family protein [Candidatus Eremiobacteraeota bacterium]
MLAYHFGLSQGRGLRRGKRLRPQLLMRVAQAEGAPAQAALDAAAAIEILHNYSLIHDDIEDGDRLRHGRPSLWAKYGIAQAINTGDALCALSYLTLLSSQSHGLSVQVARITRVLHTANLRMCEGQNLDLGFESARSVSTEDYLRMIDGKTAALFSAACEMGALCAGCDEERIGRYAALGRTFGVAFQIRDDILGTWGDPQLTGKDIAVDIARRKWTYPVVWALSGPYSEAREIVAREYGRASAIEPHAVLRVVEALDAVGSRAAAELAYHTEFSRAQRQARTAGVPALMEGLLTA